MKKVLVAGLALAVTLTMGPLVVSQAASTICDIGTYELQEYTLNILAFIDGRSHLIVQGDTVHWHHFDFAAPGRHFDAPGGNVPTFLNGTEWCPSWPGDPPDLEPCAPVNNESRNCNCDSSSFVGVPALAAQSQTVALDIVQAREGGSVTIVQQPDESNGFTLIVEFNDNPPSGPYWYEINLTYLVEEPTIMVPIDIKPGSDPNSINCKNKKGVIPVAILTTEGFDAITVDHTAVTFEGASETHVNKKSGLPRRHEGDVDGDGDIDLVFHFRLGDTDLTCDCTEGTLTGETFDGQAIEGTDAVRMIDRGGGKP